MISPDTTSILFILAPAIRHLMTDIRRVKRCIIIIITLVGIAFHQTSRSQSRLGLITSHLWLGQKDLVHIPVVSVWELEDIHTSWRNILLIFTRNLFLSVVYIASSSKIVFGFSALYCIILWRASVTFNKYYIHTFIFRMNGRKSVTQMNAIYSNYSEPNWTAHNEASLQMC